MARGIGAQVLSCCPFCLAHAGIALMKTDLAQALAKFSHSPVDALPYPIPTHAPPGPGSALLMAPELEKRRERKDKGAESSREERQGMLPGRTEPGRGGLWWAAVSGRTGKEEGRR